jgi:hypothetical protein
MREVKYRNTNHHGIVVPSVFHLNITVGDSVHHFVVSHCVRIVKMKTLAPPHFESITSEYSQLRVTLLGCCHFLR